MFYGLVGILAASLLLFATTSCGGPHDDARPAGATDVSGVPTVDAGLPGMIRREGGVATCSPGDKQDCVIDRGTFMGIHDCAKGTQVCQDGIWAACLEL